MSDIQAIAAVYEQVDHYLQSLRDTDNRAGAATTVDQERRINDQAYFVLAWGQLEADIDEACRDTIREGQLNGDWRYRRAWSLYNPDDRRLSGLSFESRLTLVLEKDSGEWKRTMQLYNVRNQIAHGTLLSARIDMARVIQDFSYPGVAGAGVRERQARLGTDELHPCHRVQYRASSVR